MTVSASPPVSRKPKWWAMLSTMKFAIWILIVLGALSLASLFSNELVDPQWMDQPAEGTGAAIGQLIYRSLEMHNPFSSWWYRGLIALLSLSLFACVLERTPIVWRLWSRKPDLDPRIVNEHSAQIYLSTTEAAETFLPRLGRSLATRLDSERVWVGESGRWALWGPLLTHVGLLLLAIGGLVGSFGGTDVRNGGYPGDIVQTEGVPFDVRIDSFRVEFYPLQPHQWVLAEGAWIGRLIERDGPDSWKVERRAETGELEYVSLQDVEISNDWDLRNAGGNIKQYISSVTILENGQPVLEKQISVNTPLRYRGYRFYQSSYDPGSPRVTATYDQLTVVVSDSLGNVLHRLPLKQNESVMIPGDTVKITAARLLPDFKLDSRRNAYSASANFTNPALELTAEGPNGFKKTMWSFLAMEGHQTVVGNLKYEATDITGRQARMDIVTIFEIRRTVGTEFLWLGFIVASLGLILCFYITHRIVYVERPSAGQPLTRVYAFSKKMIRAFEHDLASAAEHPGADVKMTVQPEIVSY
ncbi:MAG: cytochrome c biogenesis protein ResB [bacterium]|nr:cytochrome c biogenesis protein ResB [bacterium]